MNGNSGTDLQQVRAAFEAWRGVRKGRERIPESLWSAALALLDHYSMSVICRELRLSYQQIRQRRDNAAPSSRQTGFLELTTQELAAAHTINAEPENKSQAFTFPAVIERRDGSKLLVNLPIVNLETLVTSFLRA